MKQIKYLLLGLFATIIIACDSGTKTTSNNPDEQHNESSKEGTENEEGLHKFDFEISEITIAEAAKHSDLYKGTVVGAKAWKDQNGHNLFIVSILETETGESEDSPGDLSREIYGYHYLKNSDTPKLLREVKDFQLGCIFDNRLRFTERFLTITDSDKDNYGEVCFLYTLGCVSELYPDNVRLILLENGEKYTIKGSTIVQDATEKLGGEKDIDQILKAAPKALLGFAEKQWDKFIAAFSHFE